jgi:anti-sigma28 factor (negative regulator of flagellin synthesis)
MAASAQEEKPAKEGANKGLRSSKASKSDPTNRDKNENVGKTSGANQDSTGSNSADNKNENAAVPSPDTAANPSGYLVQLKSLEQRVNELKERIFRSKARLNLLKETVLHGVIAGSRSVIIHKNDMGSSFRLIKLVYAVDGAQIYSKDDDTGALDDKREFEVFNGSIVPGNHTISVLMVFRGHGYGIFSYLKGYKFTVRSSHTFTAGEGRQTAITVRAYEKGSITTDLKDRPAIKFDVNLYSAGSTAKGEAK